MTRTALLISSNSETFPAPVYPLGLARLAGAIEQAGHLAPQFDPLVHGMASLPAVVDQTQPDLVAISLRNIDNTTSDSRRCYLSEHRGLVELVRGHTSAPVAVGGSGFSLFPHPLMQMLGADYGVVGPGEKAICALLDGSDPAGVPNLIVRGNGDADPIRADDPVAPSSHQADLIDYYWRTGGMIGMQTKRGCTRSCSYCTYPLIDGHVLRHADPEAVADEMERLFRDHGVSFFFIVDSVFNLAPDHEIAFAEALARRSIPIQWAAFFAPTRSDAAYWRTLKRSGLTHVEFGTDSLCDAMLASYRKAFTAADVHRAAALCSELDLFCAHYLIFGGPDETPETLRETVAQAESLPSCALFPYAGVRIYPRTALYERALLDGQVHGDDECLMPKFYLAEGLDAPSIWELVARHAEGNREWLMPSAMPAREPMMQYLRSQGTKGPLWEFVIK